MESQKSHLMFIPRLMLRFPPILAGKRNFLRGFHQPSKMRFLRFRLHTQWCKFMSKNLKFALESQEEGEGKLG